MLVANVYVVEELSERIAFTGAVIGISLGFAIAANVA